MSALCLFASLIPACCLDAAPPALFRAVTKAPAAPTTNKTRRARVLAIDSQRLVRQATDADSTIRLNLFPDVSLDGIVESTRRDGPQKFVSRGRIPLTEPSSFLFVVRGDVVAGTVSLGEHRYRIVSLPGAAGQVVVSELIPPPAPDCACGLEHAVAAPAVKQLVPVADDGSTIDVLIAYTQKARAAVGGTPQMLALIDLAIEESNMAYLESNVVQRLRLVYAVETNYNELTGFSPALNALTNPTDGKMDELHVLRDQYGADCVQLLIDNSQYCGLAWLMTTASVAFESMAFSVVHYDCATGYYSSAHELGHNFGLNHDLQNASGGAVAPYAYGYRWIGNSGTTWRSIMAYAPGTRVQRHSNPDVLYDGVPSGTVTQENAARALNETRSTTANFRQSVLPGSPVITSTPALSSAQNQPFNYQITATNSPTSFDATGLPAGLMVNTSSGVISGTPTQAGQFPVLLTATNGTGTGQLTLQLSIQFANCAARSLVELNKALRMVSPFNLGQLDQALPALRTLRDQVLMPNPAGQNLVENYYRHGPAMSRMLVENEPLARQALPLLVELLPDLQEGTRVGGRYQLHRDQYARVLQVFDAADRAATPEVQGWLKEVRQLLARAERVDDEGKVVLEIAQALRGP